MNRKLLKSNAKAQIAGKIGMLFVITAIIYAITFGAMMILAFIPFGGLVGTIILTPAFGLSVIRIYLNIFHGKKPDVKDAFSGFDDFWSAFKVQFLIGLFTFLWSLLFFIPGIVKAYSYSMSLYILAENREKPALECISESKQMTYGHKADLFVLDLSFFWWHLLGTITFGIAYIYVVPYISATYTNVYYSLKPVTAPPIQFSPVEESAAQESGITEPLQ